MKLPKHINLTIEHNPHASHYMTAKQYLEEDLKGISFDTTEEERTKILKTNELWVIQWYPNTPIGFNVVVASTLEAALELANQ